MKEHKEYREIKSLRDKGFNIPIPILEKEDWASLLKRDPALPRSYSHLKWLTTQRFDPKIRRRLRDHRWDAQPQRGLLAPGIEECSETALQRHSR